MFKRIASLLTIAVTGLFWSGLASADIANSAHDFTQAGGFNIGGEVCEACHTPHNADAAVASSAAPLWDHEVTGATFTTYSGYDLTGGGSAPQPAGTSLMCLSCHDGTVALDNYGSVTNGSTFMTGSTLVGTDLSNDHPIGIPYTATEIAADGELQPLNNQYIVPVAGGTDTVLSGLLSNGTTVECSSCHDVHAKNTAAKLTKVDNSGSKLCLACHAK